LGYIGIVWPKEHSPEVRSFPPGTPCIYIYVCVCVCVCVCIIRKTQYYNRISQLLNTYFMITHTQQPLWDKLDFRKLVSQPIRWPTKQGR